MLSLYILRIDGVDLKPDTSNVFELKSLLTSVCIAYIQWNNFSQATEVWSIITQTTVCCWGLFQHTWKWVTQSPWNGICTQLWALSAVSAPWPAQHDSPQLWIWAFASLSGSRVPWFTLASPCSVPMLLPRDSPRDPGSSPEPGPWSISKHTPSQISLCNLHDLLPAKHCVMFNDSRKQLIPVQWTFLMEIH